MTPEDRAFIESWRAGESLPPTPTVWQDPVTHSEATEPDVILLENNIDPVSLIDAVRPLQDAYNEMSFRTAVSAARLGRESERIVVGSGGVESPIDTRERQIQEDAAELARIRGNMLDGQSTPPPGSVYRPPAAQVADPVQHPSRLAARRAEQLARNRERIDMSREFQERPPLGPTPSRPGMSGEPFTVEIRARQSGLTDRLAHSGHIDNVPADTTWQPAVLFQTRDDANDFFDALSAVVQGQVIDLTHATLISRLTEYLNSPENVTVRRFALTAADRAMLEREGVRQLWDAARVARLSRERTIRNTPPVPQIDDRSIVVHPNGRMQMMSAAELEVFLSRPALAPDGLDFVYLNGITKEQLTRDEQMVVEALGEVYPGRSEYRKSGTSRHILFHIPSVTITDGNDDHELLLRDLYTEIHLEMDTTTGKLLNFNNCFLKRATFSYAEAVADYSYSHAANGSLLYSEDFGSLCLGNSIMSAKAVELNRRVTKDNVEAFLILFYSYYSWESLEGGPYKHMTDVQASVLLNGHATLNNVEILNTTKSIINSESMIPGLTTDKIGDISTLYIDSTHPGFHQLLIDSGIPTCFYEGSTGSYKILSRVGNGNPQTFPEGSTLLRFRNRNIRLHVDSSDVADTSVLKTVVYPEHADMVASKLTQIFNNLLYKHVPNSGFDAQTVINQIPPIQLPVGIPVLNVAETVEQFELQFS